MIYYKRKEIRNEYISIYCIIIVFIVIGICTTIINEDRNIIWASVLLVIAFIGEIFIIYDINNTPTALDVYRGNTELRITYEGKIPVDTIVIYKK